MVKLGFYIGGVSASLVGATEDSRFAHVVVGHTRDRTFYYTTCGEITTSGDTGFGKLHNKALNYGWMSCNTRIGANDMYSDTDGRTLPLRLYDKYLRIKVDCGRTFRGWENNVDVEFHVWDMLRGGARGTKLYEFIGQMRIWSGRMSSDAEIYGVLRPIASSSQETVALQVYNADASTL
jgi:hypothetical protein